MNNTFNEWEKIGNFDLDTVANYIFTGKRAEQFYSDIFFYSHLVPNRILDFGCGIGRNTFELSIYDPTWTIIGYDNAAMLSHTAEYKNLKYAYMDFPNVIFSDNWNYVHHLKFDSIFCALVLQHIMERDLKEYIEHFKLMTSRLVVTGRRYNDDTGKRSTWRILEECGLVPMEFYEGGQLIPYAPDGNPEDHNSAIYVW